MPFTVTMPKLSPTMEEGHIAKWHKGEGDHVDAGELLLEVATDKATVEYNALDEGFLRKVLVKEGASAKVNQPIAIFTEKLEESIEGYTPPEEKKSAPVEEKQEAVQEEKKQTAAMQTVSMETAAHFEPEPPLEKDFFPFPTEAVQDILASPLAKKIAKEKGIDLSSIKGSGPRGRVTSRDLDLAQPKKTVSFSRREAPKVRAGSYEEIALSPMRKVIAERLAKAKTFIPHIYVRQEVDAEPLFSLREQLKKEEIQLSFNDFVVRAAALSLKEHPEINSGFHAKNSSILRFQTIDISVAVSVEGGLITPILRYADLKNLGEIHVEMKELAKRARIGKLRPEEYKGGSFTISNMGMFGITDFCAVINPPQSSILAVGGIDEVACVKGGKVKVGKRMNLVLSSDHRVVDGSDAAKFLKTLQKYLETPSLLLI